MTAMNLPARGDRLRASLRRSSRRSSTMGGSTCRPSIASSTFSCGAGVSGVCIAGATGEYPHFETADRKAVISRAADRLPPDCALLVGIGAPSMGQAVELGQAALDAGSRALLLPMPMFFRYEQEDLEAFCAPRQRHAAGALPALQPSRLHQRARARRRCSNLLRTRGVHRRDQGQQRRGGEPRRVRARRATAAPGRCWSATTALLHAGLQAGWDGGISGVAGFCPELLVAILSELRRRAAGRGGTPAGSARRADRRTSRRSPRRGASGSGWRRAASRQGRCRCP